MKKQLPQGSEIHFLTKPSFAFLLDQNPYLDKLLLLHPNLGETLSDIKQQTYDYIVDLHNNLRTLNIKSRTGIPSFAFDKLNFKKFLLTAFHLNRLPSIHIVDRYFNTIKSLGIMNDGDGLDYFSPASVDHLLTENQLLNHEFITMAIGGQHATKRMPINKLSEIIDKTRYKVVLLGGKEDTMTGNALFEKHQDKVINFVGRLSVHESAGAVDRSRLLVTHDTGMMHIAAALKKPVMAIWGNTVPDFGMTPYYGNERVPTFNFEVDGLRCRPCSKLGYSKCPKGHFNCMNLQDTTRIADKINSF